MYPHSIQYLKALHRHKSRLSPPFVNTIPLMSERPLTSWRRHLSTNPRRCCVEAANQRKEATEKVYQVNWLGCTNKAWHPRPSTKMSNVQWDSGGQGCHADVFGRTDGRTDDRTMAAGASVTWTHCSVLFEVTWG
jgi:hypothetical protein